MPTGHDAARLHPAASDVRTRCSSHARRVQPRCRPDRKWSPCDVKRALPETDIVPCAELVTGLDQPADTDEPMLLVQPDARLVGQGNHPNGAGEALGAQAGQQLGVQGVAHPTTLPRGIDVDRGLCGPLVGGPIVPWRRVCHADNAVIGGYQPGELRVQSSPDVAPFIDGLWFGPEVDERVFDVVVDDLADLGQVILGGGPDRSPDRSLTKPHVARPRYPSMSFSSINRARSSPSGEVSFCTSEGDADGFLCLTCQSTALRSSGLPRPSSSSPLRTSWRASLIPHTVVVRRVSR